MIHTIYCIEHFVAIKLFNCLNKMRHCSKKINISPTLRCVLQLRISRPQWVFFNGVKGQTGVIVQSDPSISNNGSLLLGQR